MDTEPTERFSVRRLDWGWLLDPRNGGPGEPPGRDQAVAGVARRRKLRESHALAYKATSVLKAAAKARSKRPTAK